MSRLARLFSAVDAFFAPVGDSSPGEVNPREWRRIFKVSFVSSVIGFLTMIASEFRDRPETISHDPIVSACVMGLSTCVLSYLHRRQDGSKGSNP